jgi:hypothetical protein
VATTNRRRYLRCKSLRRTRSSSQYGSNAVTPATPRRCDRWKGRDAAIIGRPWRAGLRKSRPRHLERDRARVADGPRGDPDCRWAVGHEWSMSRKVCSGADTKLSLAALIRPLFRPFLPFSQRPVSAQLRSPLSQSARSASRQNRSSTLKMKDGGAALQDGAARSRGQRRQGHGPTSCRRSEASAEEGTKAQRNRAALGHGNQRSPLALGGLWPSTPKGGSYRRGPSLSAPGEE